MQLFTVIISTSKFHELYEFIEHTCLDQVCFYS